MFNKRHYQAIALVMQELCPDLPMDDDGNYDDSEYEHGDEVFGRQTMWDETCAVLGSMFIRDNPLFKLDLFIQACKPGANVRARTLNGLRRSP